MNTKEKLSLEKKVKDAREALDIALKNLDDFVRLPENNVYDSSQAAIEDLKEKMNEEAEMDCEGFYNYGKHTYKYGFMVEEVSYTLTLNLSFGFSNDTQGYYPQNKEFVLTEGYTL